MLDIVENHVGPIGFDFSKIVPFDKAEHYHSDCDIKPNDFANHNMYPYTHCRLARLPDLNQDNPWVRSILQRWVVDQQKIFGFDGFRVDTVPEVQKLFWKELADMLNGCYLVGEVFD